MTAGRRDSLIRLERFTATQDEYGEEVQTWAEIGTEWAAVFYGRGDERREAAREQGEKTATFLMLGNAMTRGLMVRDRIVHGGGAWDIVDISLDTPRRGYVEATARKVMN